MKAATLLAVLCLCSPCWAQQPKIVVPLTAADLKQICKPFELVVLQSDLKKDISAEDVRLAYSCINFVMAIVQTIITMDVGYYPEMKLELADSKKNLVFRDIVPKVTKYIDSNPETKGAIGAVVGSLIEAKILVPKHWDQPECAQQKAGLEICLASPPGGTDWQAECRKVWQPQIDKACSK